MRSTDAAIRREQHDRGIARKWVFPILRIVVFAAIAAALVKLAFFADGAVGGQRRRAADRRDRRAAGPGRRSARSATTSCSTARVNADAAVPVKATLAGEVRKVLVDRGAGGRAGHPLLTIRSETPNPDGTTHPRKTVTVTAGAAGVLSSFTVLVGQMVAVGDTVGQVAPPTLQRDRDRSPPEQQYRLLDQPTEAQVTDHRRPGAASPAPASRSPRRSPGARHRREPADGDGAGRGGSGTTVRCAVPADVHGVPGLAAKLTIAGGIAENVLVVPMTAVEGAAGHGHRLRGRCPTARSEERPVTLGLNDGVNVEITDGLEEGELVLQFVPGAPAHPGIDGMPVDGGVIIDGKSADGAPPPRGRHAHASSCPTLDPLEILRGVDLEVEVGDHVSIVGRSGSGKSTLLNLLGLLDKPTSGPPGLRRRAAREARAAAERDRRRGRDIGFIFQQFNLLPGRTALENVDDAAALRDAGAQFWRRERIAAEMLDRVGLGDRLHSMPDAAVRRRAAARRDRPRARARPAADPRRRADRRARHRDRRQRHGAARRRRRAVGRRAHHDHPRPERRGARPPALPPRPRRAEPGRRRRVLALAERRSL